jgi:signal transduction histidine kinase
MQDVHLEISDNGRGFTLASRPDSAPQQLGLLGLAERARLVGGEFVVASIPERGTILRATVPFVFN